MFQQRFYTNDKIDFMMDLKHNKRILTKAQRIIKNNCGYSICFQFKHNNKYWFLSVDEDTHTIYIYSSNGTLYYEYFLVASN